MADSCRAYPHFADVLIYQIKTTAAVHEDSGEMVFVNYWVEHQGGRTSMPDTSRVVAVIKGDRAGRPGVEFRGDGLYSICVSERAFAPSFWYVSHVDHVYCFDFWWELFLSPSVRLGRLILVFTWCFASLVFDI